MSDFDSNDQQDTDVIDDVEMFGDKPMRWYQLAAKHQVEQIISSNPRPRIMVVLPTGAGKTLTNGSILLSSKVKQSCAKPGKPLRVLFLAHKHRLLTQAEQAYSAQEGIVTINRETLPSSFMYAPNEHTDVRLYTEAKVVPSVEIYYHSVFSDLPSDIVFDLVVCDEGHHEAMSSIQYMLEKLGDFPMIFLSATPDRADGMLVKVDHIVNPISREQAVAEGYLAPTNIHTFVDVPSKEKIDVLTGIFTSYACQMGQTMVFVRTKAEVRAIVTVLENLGYATIGILNQTERELNTILDEFSEGKWQFIVNCSKINEGVDVKGCTDVVLGRQFGSYPQLNQVIGRAARPDSECNVWELINPLSGRNLDTTVVVGTPQLHRLISKSRGQWVQREFNYITHRTNKQLGISNAVRM